MIIDERYNSYLVKGALEAAHIICTLEDASDCDYHVYHFFMDKLMMHEEQTHNQISEMVDRMFELKEMQY